MGTVTLSVLDRGVRVHCEDAATGSLITAGYGGLRGDPGRTDLAYTVGFRSAAPAFVVQRIGRPPLAAPDDGGFLALFDEDLTIELQKLRPDLYVVHAAVLRHRGVAVLLVAGSGGGKSTLCWALLHHGFGYVSDELAPIDPRTLGVHPYTRAVVLKSEPPPPYRLGEGTLRTSRGFHVAAADKTAAPGGTVPLGAIFFLRRGPAAAAPSVRPLGPAEAAARLYANALNPLAHGDEGLGPAVAIAEARPRFELVTTDLAATCALVAATLDRP